MPGDKSKRPPQPVTFGKYTLLERISHGGMAEVFRARTLGEAGFERTVAIKFLLPQVAKDEEFVTMLIDEAKIAGQLNHANIAQIFDLGHAEDRYYIVQEYVPGRDVRAILRHLTAGGQKLTLAQACHIIIKLCEGLDYAHNKRDGSGSPLNLVHRDISPQNVIVSYDGEVKLIDFGIVKAEGRATRTLAGLVKGKFAYMSPEQLRGLPVDRRSDVFACGILLYELLTGRPLFKRATEFETLRRARTPVTDPPSSLNPDVPAELDAVALRALSQHVDDRFQTAQAMRDELWNFIHSANLFYSRNELADWMRDQFEQSDPGQDAPAGRSRNPRMTGPTSPGKMGNSPRLAATSVSLEDVMERESQKQLSTDVSGPLGIRAPSEITDLGEGSHDKITDTEVVDNEADDGGDANDDHTNAANDDFSEAEQRTLVDPALHRRIIGGIGSDPAEVSLGASPSAELVADLDDDPLDAMETLSEADDDSPEAAAGIRNTMPMGARVKDLADRARITSKRAPFRQSGSAGIAKTLMGVRPDEDDETTSDRGSDQRTDPFGSTASWTEQQTPTVKRDDPPASGKRASAPESVDSRGDYPLESAITFHTPRPAGDGTRPAQPSPSPAPALHPPPPSPHPPPHSPGPMGHDPAMAPAAGRPSKPTPHPVMNPGPGHSPPGPWQQPSGPIAHPGGQPGPAARPGRIWLYLAVAILAAASITSIVLAVAG